MSDLSIVKHYYSWFSETLLYELSTSNNWGHRSYYAYWISVKDKKMSHLKFEDHIKIGKINDLHHKLLGRKR